MFLASHGINASYQTSGDGSLADVLASAVFDLDATQSASYPGTGTTWANLVTAPADGSAQTAYDFFTGDGSTSTTYPTFTGSAGDAAAYWLFDGGDYFKLKSGTNTAFLNALHKTTGGSDWAFVMAWYPPPEDGANDGLFDTRLTGTAEGILIDHNNSERITHSQRGDTALSNVAAVQIVTAETPYLVIVSHSHSTNQTRIWVNTTTAEEFSHTYNTTVDNATNPAIIGSRTNGSANRIANGGRVYEVAMFNEYFDNTKAAKIFAALEARHARDYTP